MTIKILHGLRRATAKLEVLGSAALDAHNAIEIEFREGALEAFVAGEFFPFLLAGPADLLSWPPMPADLISHRPVTRLWGRKKGAETAKRDPVWHGWPLLASWQVAVQRYDEPMPDVHAALLRPAVPNASALLGYERGASGFCSGFADGPRVTGLPASDAGDYSDDEVRAAHAPPPPAKALAPIPPPKGCGRCPAGCGLGCDGAMHCADHCEPDAEPEGARPAEPTNTSAGVPGAQKRKPRAESPQLGLFSAPAPEPPAPTTAPTRCSVCGGTYAPGEEGCAPHAHAGGASRVPAHVVRAHGPSPGRIRVRALGTCGLRFVTYGAEFDADLCPARERSVWIVAPPGDQSAGVSFRLVQGEWEPADAVVTP